MKRLLFALCITSTFIYSSAPDFSELVWKVYKFISGPAALATVMLSDDPLKAGVAALTVGTMAVAAYCATDRKKYQAFNAGLNIPLAYLAVRNCGECLKNGDPSALYYAAEAVLPMWDHQKIFRRLALSKDAANS
jgi:hypothetical protein